jgi:CheY-like chemotaxis protein
VSQEAIQQLREAIAKIAHPCVLIVEDDDNDLFFLFPRLSEFKVETVAVKTATEAISKLKEKTFSLCLLDLKLPDAPPDPVALVDRVMSANPQVPVAIVTGSLQDESLRQVLEKKVIAVWLKPVTRDQLEGLFLHENR